MLPKPLAEVEQTALRSSLGIANKRGGLPCSSKSHQLDDTGQRVNRWLLFVGEIHALDLRSDMPPWFHGHAQTQAGAASSALYRIWVFLDRSQSLLTPGVRAATLTYDEPLASYQRFLEANPGKTLQISDDCYAVVINRTLNGTYATLDGAVDLGMIFNFDPEGWDADCECWDGNVSGMQTAFCVAIPAFVDLPPLPARSSTPNQGKLMLGFPANAMPNEAREIPFGIYETAGRMNAYQGSRSL